MTVEAKIFGTGLGVSALVTLGALGLGTAAGNLLAAYETVIIITAALAIVCAAWLYLTGSRRAAFLCLVALATCGAACFTRCNRLGITGLCFGLGCLAYFIQTLIYLFKNLDSPSEAARQRFEKQIDEAVRSRDDRPIKTTADDSVPFMQFVWLSLGQMIIVMFLSGLLS